MGHLRKALIMISGGIDSPVAAFLTINEGFHPLFLFFDNSPYDRFGSRDKVLKICDFLKRKKYRKKNGLNNTWELISVPHGNDLTQILRKCPRKLTCILCRRQMFRAADLIAKKEDVDIIVTGEILGEQASQTLINLGAVSTVISNATLVRPLLGYNKSEVIKISRDLGLYDYSIEPGGCCSVDPKFPETRVRMSKLLAAEQGTEFEEIVNEDVNNAERFLLSLPEDIGTA